MAAIKNTVGKFRVSPSLLVAAVLAASGASLSAHAGPAYRLISSDQQTERYQNLELFQKVLHFVESNYVDEVKNKDLVYGAIKGMLETLDPHSNFLPPDVFREMRTETSGKYGGLGIELGMKDNVLTIVSPIEDTPAWRAGLKPNDRIIKIDGESTKGFNLSEAVNKMRGKNGTKLTLTIYREGLEKPRDFVLTREMVKVASVKSELIEPHFGYVRLSNFNETAASDVKAAIDKIEAKSGKLKGLVFDLRMNPGGLLDQAVDVASLFVDEGTIVSTIGRNHDQKEVKYARKGMARKDLQLAVLVNSSSASAAEIVAGAIQDHHRGIIMGTPTFGKGSVQQVIELPPDMGLKLTIARYYTPSGRSIQEKGVQPDIVLDDFDPKLLAEARRKSEATRERDLKGHMVNTGNADLKDTKHAEEFKKEELEALSQTGKKADKADLAKDDGLPQKLEPKEDYQVREAVNYLKSYEFFRKLATVDTGTAPLTPVEGAKSASNDTPASAE